MCSCWVLGMLMRRRSRRARQILEMKHEKQRTGAKTCSRHDTLPHWTHIRDLIGLPLHLSPTR